MNEVVPCLFSLVGVPLVLLVALLGAVAVAKIVFEPLERRGNYLLGARFGIGDVMCLLLVLQLTLAPWWLAFRKEASTTAMMLSVAFLWTLFAAGWLGGVTSLSRAGIQSVWRRGLFLAMVVPVTYIAAAATFFGVVLGSIFLMIALFDDQEALPLFITLLSGLVVAILVWGLRSITSWVAATSPHARSSQPMFAGWPLYPGLRRWPARLPAGGDPPTSSVAAASSRSNVCGAASPSSLAAEPPPPYDTQ